MNNKYEYNKDLTWDESVLIFYLRGLKEFNNTIILDLLEEKYKEARLEVNELHFSDLPQQAKRDMQELIYKKWKPLENLKEILTKILID